MSQFEFLSEILRRPPRVLAKVHMLDTGTIQALQSFPELVNLRAFSLEIVSPVKGGKSHSRAQAYVDKILSAVESAQRTSLLDKKKWADSLRNICDIVNTLNEEDRINARSVLEEALEQSETRQKEVFSTYRHSVKTLRVALKKAVKNFPERKTEISMIFEEADIVSKMICENLADHNAAVRSFVAALDQEASHGDRFDNPQELSEFLRRL